MDMANEYRSELGSQCLVAGRHFPYEQDERRKEREENEGNGDSEEGRRYRGMG
jgi:hypothetical protein